MNQPAPNKRSRTILIVLLLLLLLLALLIARCQRRPAPPPPDTPAPEVVSEVATPTPAITTSTPEEILTPATIQLRARTVAGSTFSVSWTGPDNPGDYLAIARPDAPAGDAETYTETKHGRPLELTAPIETGDYEVRYIAVRSKTILGRTPLHVSAATATLDAPESAPLNTPISVTWSGPDNADDFLTIVAPGAADDAYGKYTPTAQGSPASLVGPDKPGPAEIRYVTGKGRKILARRPIEITQPPASIEAADEAIAGAPVSITWAATVASGDYLTIVPPDAAPGVYQNYNDASRGSPLTIAAPIDPGRYEIRYIGGRGKIILARRPLNVIAADLSLHAPAQAVAGEPVLIHWTGPNNRGDYLTIVVKSARDGLYAHYAETQGGSPSRVKAPKQTGTAEIRYMSGQGARVLARREIEIVP